MNKEISMDDIIETVDAVVASHGGEATLKVIPCRRRGAPKGNANAKKPEVEKRVTLSTSIKKETRAELFRRAEEAGVSVGRIIDGLVSPP